MPTYQELALAHPELVAMYQPPLSYRQRATLALHAYDTRRGGAPEITDEQRQALLAYANGQPPGGPYVYRWCANCNLWIGYVHQCCTSCIANGQAPRSEEACSGECGSCTNHCTCTRCSSCNNREAACDCIHCSDCGEVTTDSVCESCSRCSSCCNCYSCNDCDNRFRAVDGCPSCSRCNDCGCSCSDDEVEVRGMFPVKHPKERKRFDCTRLVGVEWEYNRVNDNAPITHWVRRWGGGTHPDGSCGSEAITPPVAGDHMVKCIEDLGQAFENADAVIDDKCSIHVHVDARDMRWADMYRLIRVYTLLEPALYIIGGQQRASNRYAQMCGPKFATALANPEDRRGAILAAALDSGNAMDSRRFMRNRVDKKSGGRYKGLNIIPWIAGRAGATMNVRTRDRKTGQFKTIVKRTMAPDTTIEFRIHRNTSDPARVVGWAKLCARIVDWVSKANDQQAIDLPKSPMRALCVIAPDLAPWIMQRLLAWKRSTKRDGGVKRRIKIMPGGQYSIC